MQVFFGGGSEKKEIKLTFLQKILLQNLNLSEDL